MWGHHQPDVSDHPEHDGDAPDGVVAVPLLLLGHQDEPEVGQDVGAQQSASQCSLPLPACFPALRVP